MTMNLYWEPLERQPSGDLDDKLKFVLRKRSVGSVDIAMDAASIPYLRGLSDAGVHDADKLIDAIHKHGRIRVFER